jgi:hypothetical protein
LAENSSSVARSCSLTAFSRASSWKIVAFFSPSSTFMRLIAVGLLAELGELAGGLVLELLDAHLQPPRRHGKFSAQLILVGLISAIDRGVAASIRLVVSRTARLCTKRHDHQAEQH